jgi:predicted HD phosphohydrolase
MNAAEQQGMKMAQHRKVSDDGAHTAAGSAHGGPGSLDVVALAIELFEARGRRRSAGLGQDGGITLLDHALQTAQLAEWAQAPRPLVAAALLHDIGHLLANPGEAHPCDDVHELRALGLLGSAFDRDVLEPIRLHVQAKRYLVAVDRSHAAALPASARASLALQGGPMSRDEVWLFEDTPYAEQAVALRRWDDAAHAPGKGTPPLDYYLDLLREVRSRPESAPRTGRGAPDVS